MIETPHLRIGAREAALAIAALLFGGCGAADEPHPNVLLITVDTLRADFLSSYGGDLVPTPGIDALAANGARFETAFAASSATVPSHASIMSSRFAREHSVGPFNGPTRLEGVATLAERFRAAGYATAAFVSSAVLTRRAGLDRGFETYDDELSSAESNRARMGERIASETGGRAIRWLLEQAERPFFLWVHLQDPHGPYEPPPPYADLAHGDFTQDRTLPRLDENSGRGGIPRYQQLEGLDRWSEYATRYAGEIAFMDVWVAKLVEAATAARGGSGSVVLFTADHGESLGEDGYFFQHGHATTAELAHVPFILVAPDVPSGNHSVTVHHVDIAPTLLELAGLAPLPKASGMSLAAMLRGGAPLPERTLFCDTLGESSAYRGRVQARIRGPAGLELGGQQDAAFDGPPDSLAWGSYARSPDGRWLTREPDARRRSELLEYVNAGAPRASTEPLSNEQAEQLRALGYLPAQ